jgi:hypothetical protein
MAAHVEDAQRLSNALPARVADSGRLKLGKVREPESTFDFF